MDLTLPSSAFILALPTVAAHLALSGGLVPTPSAGPRCPNQRYAIDAPWPPLQPVQAAGRAVTDPALSKYN